jgi:putative oxidoreductase
MALAHGLGKVPPSEAFTQGVAELGFPAPALFAWCAAAAELLGGLGLALGALTRLSAGSVAFTMIVAAFGRHASDPYRMKELSLLYLAIALFFLIAGAGRYSVDAWLATRKR